MPTAAVVRRFSPLPLLALVACLSGEHGTVIFPPGGLTIDSTGRQERIWSSDTLIRLRQVGGASDGDTTFLNPYLVTADADQIYLFDTDNRVLCYDTLGRRRWTQGQAGGGPGEYRNPRDLKVAPDGRLWLVDPESGRVTVLGRENGAVIAMLPMKIAYSPMITPLRSGFALYPPDLATDIHYFSPAGEPLGTDSLPWAGYHQLEPLARQIRTAVDRGTGRWALGFIYGNGWFAFDTTGKASDRHYYVEPSGFPAVERTVRGNTIQTSLIRSPGAALDMHLTGDTLFVLFDGREPYRRRKLDMYSVETGAYYGSILLPEPADNIGVSGNLLSVFATNPVPHLTFYRRQRRPAVSAAD